MVVSEIPLNAASKNHRPTNMSQLVSLTHNTHTHTMHCSSVIYTYCIACMYLSVWKAHYDFMVGSGCGHIVTYRLCLVLPCRAGSNVQHGKCMVDSNARRPFCRGRYQESTQHTYTQTHTSDSPTPSRQSTSDA